MPSREVISPSLAEAVPAEYPTEAGNARHISVLSMIVGQDGSAGEIEVLNARTGPFERSAIAAIKRSKFMPGSLRGQPVPVRTRVWIPFTTSGQAATPVAAPFKIDKPPVLMNSLDPKYRRAMSQIKPGVVITVVLVDDEGNTKAAHIYKSLEPKADDLALQIVETYRFSPATRDGIPVPVDFLFTVNFTPTR